MITKNTFEVAQGNRKLQIITWKCTCNHTGKKRRESSACLPRWQGVHASEPKQHFHIPMQSGRSDQKTLGLYSCPQGNTQGSRPGLQASVLGFLMMHRDWIKSFSTPQQSCPGRREGGITGNLLGLHLVLQSGEFHETVVPPLPPGS